MVADFIRLGANVNEKNNLGKSCLHLSAEQGYIRVLEVRAFLFFSAVLNVLRTGLCFLTLHVTDAVSDSTGGI